MRKIVVATIKGGVGVYWEQKEYSAKDKERTRHAVSWSSYQKRQSVSMVEEMMKQLDSGDWADAVNRINHCGSRLVSDAAKYA